MEIKKLMILYISLVLYILLEQKEFWYFIV